MSSDEVPLIRPEKPLSEQRIAVIGAGPAGLSVLCAFVEAAKKVTCESIPQVTCFERQSAIGGQWNFTWRTGVDEKGEPAHSGMYPHLWSNGPKECLEFGNYTFLQHFGKDVPSYPPRDILADYVVGRAKHFELEKYVQFETAVRRVTYDDESRLFTVVTQELKSMQESIQQYDYVFCCSGHFHIPKVPSFPGFATFPGHILHAHDVRHFQGWRDKRVLVVGTSYSAEDMALQAYKFGCRDVTLCYRTAPMDFNWPSDAFSTRPLLTAVDGSTATFLDGTTKDVDVIVLSTGYFHRFPFMEEKLQLKTDNLLWIDDLYKGMFWNPNPRLIYVAMHDQWLTFNMFDAQAWYARDVILGKIEIPTEAEREKDMKLWGDRGATCKDAVSSIRFQMDYTCDLAGATDYPSWDYEVMLQCFLDWKEAKGKDIFGYRNMAHRSVFTGSTAPVPKIPWRENMDDSLKSFLEN